MGNAEMSWQHCRICLGHIRILLKTKQKTVTRTWTNDHDELIMIDEIIYYKKGSKPSDVCLKYKRAELGNRPY
jgi:hypothetical protein